MPADFLSRKAIQVSDESKAEQQDNPDLDTLLPL